MTMLEVRADLAARVREIARREQRPVDEVLETLLASYESHMVAQPEDEAGEAILPGSLAALAQAAQKVTFRSGETDIAARSREILETEFAEYLIRRMHGEDVD